MIRGALIVATVGAVGCGYNCQDTCNHVYSDSECDVSTGQIDESKKIAECIDVCQDALANTGDLGTYDPFSPYRGGDQPAITNERQAAFWMECVWAQAPERGPQASCALLEPSEGYCAPI